MKKEKQILARMVNIHKWFEKVHALKGVDFEIYKREVVGLIGGNGAGKSTLIKILTGVLQQNEGDIYWKGGKVKINSVDKARELGIETVYQEQAVIGDRNVAQNVFLGREPTTSFGPINILDYEKMKKESMDLTKKIYLNIPSVEQEVRFCSGGERQGVAIARAIYFNADLIILDEPTTALSVSGIRKVMNFIKQMKETGGACIFISHDLHHVYPVADRLFILSKGEKIGDFKKEETSIEELEELIISK